MLEAKNISFGYDEKNKLLKDISMRFSENEIVGLIGPSGCGKSTFSKILAGYIVPQAGEVLFDGKKLPRQGYCPVQLIYQHPEKAVDPKWKMKEVLAEGWDIDKETLSALGIKEEWLTRWPNELSGGELQRFCIARALGPKTRFIIADEMTTMLDAITQASIWKVIVEQCKARNIGLIAVTHNHALADRICDRIIDFEELTR
ncbi:MAG: ATP-binding cassette domain-containing protein [Peptostreptococcaceae bacterium]|nr:ATP-binding cassette domain-containing protein [Peptostreptococcaceae bacterium]